MKQCECGGLYYALEDLDGLFCAKCNKHIEDDGTRSIDKLSAGYTEARAKVMRGVPMSYIKVGSETKGRVEIAIPCYFTPVERRELINAYLDDLEYTKDSVDKRGLDIYTGRK